jgi:hypothetical protein
MENIAVSSLDSSRLFVDTNHTFLLGCGSNARKGHHGAYTACHNSGGALVVSLIEGTEDSVFAC